MKNDNYTTKKSPYNTSMFNIVWVKKKKKTSTQITIEILLKKKKKYFIKILLRYGMDHRPI